MSIRDIDDQLFAAATGRSAPKVGDTGVRSLRSMVKRLGGTKAAAQQLGVSVRTVQRWTAKTTAARGRPSKSSTTAIRDEQQRQRQAEAARRLGSGTRGSRAGRLRSTGAKLSIRGEGGPTGYSAANPTSVFRDREEEVSLSGDEVERLYAAIADGDPDATNELINGWYDEKYMQDMHAGWDWDSIREMHINPR